MNSEGSQKSPPSQGMTQAVWSSWCVEKDGWKPYPPEVNTKLEDAYNGKQMQADIGDYIVLFEEFLQIHKNGTLPDVPVQRQQQKMIEDALAIKVIVYAKRPFHLT